MEVDAEAVPATATTTDSTMALAQADLLLHSMAHECSKHPQDVVQVIQRHDTHIMCCSVPYRTSPVQLRHASLLVNG